MHGLRAQLFAAVSISLVGCGPNTSDSDQTGTGEAEADSDTASTMSSGTESSSESSDPSTDPSSGSESSSGSDTEGLGGCEGGVPILFPSGVDSGLVHCPDGSVDRAFEVACPEGTSPCRTDADCGAGSVCICPGIVPDTISGWTWPAEGAPSVCVPSSCRQAVDCASAECGLAIDDSSACGGGEITLACRTPEDTCRADDQCTGTYIDQECGISAEQRTWRCVDQGCIGRPLFDARGQLRFAGLGRRPGWQATLRPRLEGLAPALRRTLARRWAHAGLMEHASIASFARFSLQLAAQGAPPSLCRGAAQAMADERAHARLCLGLAGAYAGEALAPTSLPIDALGELGDWEQFAAGLIDEACVEECLGVGEAGHALAACRDPEVARALERIVADETRHAALAWATLRWAFESAGPARRRFLASRLRAAIDRAAAYRVEEGPEPPPPGLGLLTASERVAARREVLRAIVEPCATALLERYAAAAATYA